MEKIQLFSPRAKEIAQELDLKMGKANLDAFSETVRELARQDPSILVVTSDSRGSGKLVPFAEEFPEQIVEVGIAEQNLVGVAAGLASTHRPVFAVSPSCFLTARSLEQIKNDVAYSDNRVTLIGISSGVSYGALGTTHHSLHDFAALRAINNLDIVVPGDNIETRAVIRASVAHPRPLFIRFGKAPMYDLHPAEQAFEIGKAIRLREGSDLTLLATGELLQQAVLAAQLLSHSGISVEVISVHSLRPLDTEAILTSARKTGVVVTMEEHMVHGGLGEACAALLLQSGVHPTFRILGIPDAYTVTGSQAEIFYHYDLHMEGIASTCQRLLG
jgi:transketolase